MTGAVDNRVGYWDSVTGISFEDGSLLSFLSIHDLHSNQDSKKEELTQRNQRVIDPEIGRTQLEEKLAKQREELKVKQEKEWKELNVHVISSATLNLCRRFRKWNGRTLMNKLQRSEDGWHH